jgi:uncharacterized membrane protein YqaE (UPF0057 family)
MRKGLILLMAILTLGSSFSFSSHAAVINPVSSTTPSSEPDSATVNSAMQEFKSLSHKEKKGRMREAKKAWKDFMKQKKDGGDPSVTTLLLVILAIILPPLAVYLHQGSATPKFWISLLLCVLAFLALWLWIIPVVFALLVVLNAI